MKPQDLTPPNVELSDLVKPINVPPIRRFTAKFTALRYKLWLTVLREIAIYQNLITNFDKLNPETFKDYKRIKFLHDSSMMKRLISLAANKLRRRIY